MCFNKTYVLFALKFYSGIFGASTMNFDLQIFLLLPVTGVQFFSCHKRNPVHDNALVLVKLLSYLMLLNQIAKLFLMEYSPACVINYLYDIEYSRTQLQSTSVTTS